MAEELRSCQTCGCSCAPEAGAQEDQAPTASEQDAVAYHEETKLAVLIALVPAMTMTIFNLMGLI